MLRKSGGKENIKQWHAYTYRGLTFLRDLGIVRSLSEATHILGETDAGFELRLKNVALVEEEDQVDYGAEGGDEACLDCHCMLLVSETFPRCSL